MGKPCLTGVAPLLLLFAQLAPQRDTSGGFGGSRTAQVKLSAPAWCPCGFYAFARLHRSALEGGIRGGRGGVLKNVKRGREGDAVSAKTSGRKVRGMELEIRRTLQVQLGTKEPIWRVYSLLFCAVLAYPLLPCPVSASLNYSCVSFYLFYTKRVIFM